MTLAAPRLAKRGPARFDRTSTVDLVKRRQQIFHLPITNKLLLRLHPSYPIAEERYGSLIDQRGDQRRHLPTAAPRHALEENRALRIAGSNQHCVVDAEGVVLRSRAEEIHLLRRGREAQFQL